MQIKLLGNWDVEKDVEDFRVVADNLKIDGQQSRADVVDYLIERVKLEQKSSRIISKFLAYMLSKKSSGNLSDWDCKHSEEILQEFIRINMQISKEEN